MNKDKFKELAVLFLLDELGGEDKVKFENALLENDDYKSEFEEIKSFIRMISENKPAEAEESVLMDARYSLMRKIRTEEDKVSIASSFRNLVDGFLYRNYKFVFSAAATVLIGIFIGYMMFSVKQPQPQYAANQELNNSIPGSSKVIVPDVNNVLPSKENNIEEENKFDAVTPVRSKEKRFAPAADKYLTASFIFDENPGVRLQAVNKIAQNYDDKKLQADVKLKQALITALKEDPNPAVRIEAFTVLTKYPFDEPIRDAFLYVLTNDKNSGLRIKAIKVLSELKFKGQILDEKTRKVLSRKAETDNNGFVRIHAASMLKEEE